MCWSWQFGSRWRLKKSPWNFKHVDVVGKKNKWERSGTGWDATCQVWDRINEANTFGNCAQTQPELRRCEVVKKWTSIIRLFYSFFLTINWYGRCQSMCLIWRFLFDSTGVTDPHGDAQGGDGPLPGCWNVILSHLRSSSARGGYRWLYFENNEINYN